MKVGDIVESRNPRIDSYGFGIIIEKWERTSFIPAKYIVYWSDTHKITRVLAIDLWKINKDVEVIK